MELIAKTLYGLENILAGELALLGASKVRIANRAVGFEGGKELLYEVNYMSATALSVLKKIAGFKIKSSDDLYNKAKEIPWDKFMNRKSTFAVVPVVSSSLFRHSGFPALRVKDAIADYFREKYGLRPDVDKNNPQIIINLHISNDDVTLSLDSSGEPLFKRGYRKASVQAPLNEVLAAGMLRLSGWNASEVLIDPMCGSGTIPVEAAMMAAGIPPAFARKSFGFELWPDYDRDLFRKIKEKHNAKTGKPGTVNIFGYDISERAVQIASANAERAGTGKWILFEVKDFMDLKSGVKNGTLILNPPYGERMSAGEPDSLYSAIGTALKHNFEGFTAWIITPSEGPVKHIGLKPSEKHILFNGAIECRFLKFELYGGSKKKNTPNIS